MTMHMSKKMLASANGAAPASQGRQFIVGYSMPRNIRSKVQASSIAGRKKSHAIAPHSPQSPVQELALSPTGRMAVGPWLGPFAPLAEEPTTLYLDNRGSAHVSLDDVQLEAGSTKEMSMLRVGRAAQRRANVRMAASREARDAMWTRRRGANVMATRQINQARPRSMN